jgi:hypothetical protein
MMGDAKPPLFAELLGEGQIITEARKPSRHWVVIV